MVNRIKKSLDEALKVALYNEKKINTKDNSNSVILEGFMGMRNKSSTVKEWADDNDCFFRYYNPCKDSSIVYKDNGYGVLEKHEVDPDIYAELELFCTMSKILDEKNTIIYLPNYKYADDSCRKAVERIIQTQHIYNPITKEKIYWKNFLFAVMDND